MWSALIVLGDSVCCPVSAELAVMIPHIGQVMDYDALEKSTTTEEMTEAIMSSVQGMYEIVGKYIMPILAFSALCTFVFDGTAVFERPEEGTNTS